MSARQERRSLGRSSNELVGRNRHSNVRRKYSQIGIGASEGNDRLLVRKPQIVLDSGEFKQVGGGTLGSPKRDPSTVGSDQ